MQCWSLRMCVRARVCVCPLAHSTQKIPKNQLFCIDNRKTSRIKKLFHVRLTSKVIQGQKMSIKSTVYHLPQNEVISTKMNWHIEFSMEYKDVFWSQNWWTRYDPIWILRLLDVIERNNWPLLYLLQKTIIFLEITSLKKMREYVMMIYKVTKSNT